MTGALEQPEENDSLHVCSDTTPERVVVHVEGEVDLITAPRLSDELTNIENGRPPPRVVVVDLTDVSFLASAGLSVLLEHNQRCRENGQEFRVVAGNRTIARTIDLTGLTDVLSVQDNAFARQ
jgi:anti-sigma B factor antagonist